jgi:hypothetical protein
LGDGDGVILKPHFAVVVEERDARLIVLARVVSLGGERHIILAQFSKMEALVDLWHLMPEGQVALLGSEIGGEDTAVII